MADPLNVPIATIPKGREEIRVALSEYRGAQFVDVRTYASFTVAMGEKSATPKGITIPFHALGAFVRAVTDAETQARALGLIGGAE